jgi:tetratricopeptide (TPR) repeat protein
MFDSNEKSEILNEIGKLINPLYLEKLGPIRDKATGIINQEGFERSTTSVVEATTILHQALETINQMIDSSEKSRELEDVSKIINQTCSTAIKVREDNGLGLVDQKKYEDAISEMYSALSIAKHMASEEDQKKEVEIIKTYINRVYSAEIEDKLDEGKELLDQKKFDEARDIFNDAMRISNKMYVSDEVEREISTIKNLLYQAEMKGVVATGISSEEQKKFEQELDALKNELDRANTITDTERRRIKIEDVKLKIDNIYSSLIKLAIEQGNLQADTNNFDTAGKEIENALKLTEVIEYSAVRDDELKKIIAAVSGYGNLLAKQKKYDEAYKKYDTCLDITERIKEKEIQTEQVKKVKLRYEQELDNKVKQDIEEGELDIAIKYCQKAIDLDKTYVESYVNLGNAHINKKEYDKAIEHFDKAVNLDSNSIGALTDRGFAFELKNDYENALKSLEKAIEVDPDYDIAWYRKGNVLKHKNEVTQAIESYKKATKINSDFAQAWLFMGSLQFDNKEYNKAIECIDKAIELDSGISKEIGSIIKDFKNLENSIQEKLALLFKNK